MVLQTGVEAVEGLSFAGYEEVEVHPVCVFVGGRTTCWGDGLRMGDGGWDRVRGVLWDGV